MDTEMSNTERPSFNLDSPPSIFIIGAGGIGCAVGYGLLAAGIRVIFVESNQDKIRWGRAHGVTIDGRKPLPAEFISFDDWDPPSRATVILCTKCYDNVTVLGRLPPDVTLVPIQNGFDSALDGRIKLEGIASFVSECEPGRTQARITRRGQLHFGFRSDALPTIWPDFVSALQKCELFRTVLVSNILPFKYTKLMYNAAISPLAASAGLDNGQLLWMSAARHLFFELLLENYTILHDANICLGKIGPFHPDRVAGILRRPVIAHALAWAFYPTLRGSYCSMTPDLRLLKGRTEIDYYNRHLIKLAGDRPCPLNRRVYHLIKQMESERIVPCIDTLSQLSR
jgi:2-dehydropantoate 2-reductase